MKTLFSILSLLLLTALFSTNTAQTVVPVAPGAGTLESAIATSPANSILQLTGGAAYTLSSRATTFGNIDKKLTIQTAGNGTEKAIIRLSNDANKARKFYFFTLKSGGSLTLKGLEIHGAIDEETIAGSMILFDGRPSSADARFGNFRFEDCIFHSFSDNIINGMKDDYARGSIQDTVFIKNVTVYNANHFLQYKHVSLRHLEMSNSTIYKLSGMALKIGKIGYRCILQHPNKPYIPISEHTITPTGFIDHCTMDDLGDIHGHIQVDDAYEILKITNCIFSRQQQKSQPAIYFMDPQIETAAIIENSAFWDCSLPTTDLTASKLIGYQFIHSQILNPEFVDIENNKFFLPENSPLLTAAKDGGSIGDLRWLGNSTGVFPTYNLANLNLINYPNPVFDAARIEFSLPTNGLVQLEIYDLNGRKIQSLIDNEWMHSGSNSYNWNRKSTQSGIYYLRLTFGQTTQTRKVILK